MSKLKKSPRTPKSAKAYRTCHRAVEVWVSEDIPEIGIVITDLSVPFVEENDNHPLIMAVQRMIDNAEAPLDRIELHPDMTIGIYHHSTSKMCVVMPHTPEAAC